MYFWKLVCSKTEITGQDACFESVIDIVSVLPVTQRSISVLPVTQILRKGDKKENSGNICVTGNTDIHEQKEKRENRNFFQYLCYR